MDDDLGRLEALEAAVAFLQADNAELWESMDHMWLITCAIMVYLMQVGFALLEAGSVRAKSTTSILVKNVADSLVGYVTFYAVGYGVAFGDDVDGRGLLGGSLFLLQGEDRYSYFFFQAAFACTAVTIVSGAVAERMKYRSYSCVGVLLASLVYPAAAHWVWHEDGWLATLWDVGVIDHAGCGPVHIVGGVAGLCAAVALGPRKGWIDIRSGRVVELDAHSVPLVVTGAFFLWIGWLGFNAGSTITIRAGELAGEVAVNTVLASASGAGAAFLLHRKSTHIYSAPALLNGLLTGLVSVTAMCATAEPWACFVAGGVGGTLYHLGARLRVAARVDDPLDACVVHGLGGTWGLVAAGLFSNAGGDRAGVLYGGFQVISCQLVAIFVIALWTAAIVLPALVVIEMVYGLRVAEVVETLGLDSKMGGSAYPEWFKMAELLSLITSFDDIVNDQSKTEQFMDFLTNVEHAEESLEFVLDVRSWKAEAARNQKTRSMRRAKPVTAADAFADLSNASLAGARTLYNTYVKIGAEKQVNIARAVMDEIAAALEADASDDLVDAGVFDRAVDDLRQLLTMGPLKRHLDQLQQEAQAGGRSAASLPYYRSPLRGAGEVVFRCLANSRGGAQVRRSDGHGVRLNDR